MRVRWRCVRGASTRFAPWRFPRPSCNCGRAGRLIRDPADRGLLVICDPRLQTQSYGRLVRKSLPPMPECANEAEALAWAQQL